MLIFRVRNKYYEMMKDPRVREMLNELAKDKSNVLIKDIDEKNKERVEKIRMLDQKLYDILEFIRAEKEELKKI